MRGTPSPPLHLCGIDASTANIFSHFVFTNVPVLVPTLEAYVHYLPKVFANPRMAHQAQPADSQSPQQNVESTLPVPSEWKG